MKRIFLIYHIPVLLLSLLLTSSCSDYLDRETDSLIDKSMTFTSYERTSRYLINIYSLLPDGLNRMGDGAMFDAATDDGEHASEDASVQKFNTGSWNAVSNPDNLWNRYYAGIRMACELIENADKVDLERYRLDPNNQPEYQNRLKDIRIWKAEARFLRAFFHFELMKRFGPIPLISSSLSINEDYRNMERPAMEQCIDFISKECDAAASDLDLTPWRDESALGHATKGAALALKSRLLLYAASPLYLDWENTSETSLPSDQAKWSAAAKAAKAVIDLGQYALHPDYGDLFKNAFRSSEYIMMRRYAAGTSFESYNFPISYGGKGGMNPSQNLVDAYEKLDGSTFSWDNETDKAHPYLNRDARLNETIILNDSLWQNKKVETFNGGKDGKYKANATKTGYYLKKFANNEVNIVTGGGAVGHTWPLFRLAEIYLNYAESLNESDPGNPDILLYLNAVRHRAGLPDLDSGLSQESMREYIRKERRIELAFEEHRAWDVRRWKIGTKTLGADLRGVNIAKLSTPVTDAVGDVSSSNGTIPSSEIPSGWYYYDGDEFNGLEINNRYWGIYGDNFTFNANYGAQQGMLQTYRKEQVAIANDGNKRVARITATRDGNPPAPANSSVANRPGWWSGALSSRDTKNYGFPGKMYPLFSRIEVKAKIPYEYGVWMAAWLRHYLGAGVAELDLEEFFIKYYQTTNSPYQVNQTVHVYNSETGKTDVNANKMNRYTILSSNPSSDYHTYGVQVDPDPAAPREHAIISFLFDGQVTNVWKTKDYGEKYNSFIKRAFAEHREMTTWDIALTGQIGGNDSSVGFPEDKNPNLRQLTMDIDWVRVFTRTDPNSANPPIQVHEKYSYEPYVVESRNFQPKMYWYPIPESELLKMNSWKQNPGW